MIARLGSRITVHVFRTISDRQRRVDPVICSAVVTSDGPPGVVGVWAITVTPPRRWLLVRKSLTAPDKQYDAIEGDTGRFG